MKTYKLLATGLAAGALTLASCTPTQQKYGLGGAAIGAAGAAVLGGDSTDVARGAVIGGAGGTGYAIYKDRQNKTTVAPPQQPVAPAATKAPAAYPTDTPGIVISPHKPYNRVDVKGMSPGQLVIDPKTNKHFVVPQ